MTPNRHILFFAEFFHPDICATAVVAADQLALLADLRPDWRITVIAGNHAWHDPNMTYPARETIGRVDVIRVNRPPLRTRSLLARTRGFAAYYFRAIDAARGLAPVDVVIGTTAPPMGGRIARKVAARLGCPFVYKIYDVYPDTAVTLGRFEPNSLATKLWLRDDTHTMQRAAAVVCIAKGIETRLQNTRDIDPSRLHTIHDGFDHSRIVIATNKPIAKDDASQEPIAQAIDSPRRAIDPAIAVPPTDRPLVIQYAGNMGLSHPFNAILDAARQLSADADVRFQFIGDGPARDALASQLPSNAEWLPFQPDQHFAALLAHADVCLVTQHEQLFDQALPYKVYGILAAAKPMIFVGNLRSEVADWIRDAGCGLTVSQSDSRKLADAIASLKSDHARRAEMGRRARALFDERFHVRIAAQKWIELLKQVLAVNSP